MRLHGALLGRKREKLVVTENVHNKQRRTLYSSSKSKELSVYIIRSKSVGWLVFI
jgi:hypothetical protein